MIKGVAEAAPKYNEKKEKIIMTVKNFVERFKTEDVNLKTLLEIRTYIPIAEKRVILEGILDRCFTIEDSVLTCDYVLKKMMFELAMVKYHTNLDIDITSEEDYDAIQMLWNTTVDFSNEYDRDSRECQSMLRGMERELRAQYSIESSISKLSHKLSDNIESVANLIAKKVDDFDMSKLGLDGLELNQLTNLLNKYGK